VQKAYKAIGLIRGRTWDPEPIAELLEGTLAIPKWNGWGRLLGPEYRHACHILAQAAPIQTSAKSFWLQLQNSFNNAIFLAFQHWLADHNLQGRINIYNSRGELIDFGTLLHRDNAFSRRYPKIADSFRQANSRRNSLPSAHPYARKGGGRTRPLSAKEQRDLIRKLRLAFIEVAKIVDSAGAE
jgi:hypothetical protein